MTKTIYDPQGKVASPDSVVDTWELLPTKMPLQWRLLTYLLKYGRNGNPCYESRKKIAESLGTGVRQMQTALEKLKEAKLVRLDEAVDGYKKVHKHAIYCVLPKGKIANSADQEEPTPVKEPTATKAAGVLDIGARRAALGKLPAPRKKTVGEQLKEVLLLNPEHYSAITSPLVQAVGEKDTVSVMVTAFSAVPEVAEVLAAVSGLAPEYATFLLTKLEGACWKQVGLVTGGEEAKNPAGLLTTFLRAPEVQLAVSKTCTKILNAIAKSGVSNVG
jgi:hypothetical protein